MKLSSWTENTNIVWRNLGIKYVRDKNNNIPENSGQIVQKYLFRREDEGFTFTFQGKDGQRKECVRRCLKRAYPTISTPVDDSVKKVHCQLSSEVLSGEIDIGVSIVERQYAKQILNKNGHVETLKFSVYGRKHPLINIRTKLLKKHIRYMRLNNDAYFDNISIQELTTRLASINELNSDDTINSMKLKLKNYERTRNLIVWHDASIISNHSHILFCVNVMFDPAVFYTSAEYREISGNDVDVQSEIERPELYIIGRCRSNDEQLGYIETRIECLKDLAVDVNLKSINEECEEITISDRMRFFHGDGPASALEAGNQKGGYYFCPSCDVNLCNTDIISYSYLQKICSLEDIRHKVLKGTFGKIRSQEGKLALLIG